MPRRVNASRNKNSICALTLGNSLEANRSIASHNFPQQLFYALTKQHLLADGRNIALAIYGEESDSVRLFRPLGESPKRHSSWCAKLRLTSITVANVQTIRNTYLWTSIAIAMSIIVGLLSFYEWQNERQLIQAETRSDVHIVQAIGNIVWNSHAQYIEQTESLTKEQLLEQPHNDRLLREIEAATRDLPVLKVKLFSPVTGRVFFSTEKSQIGDLTHAARALTVSQLGKESSELSFRNQFNAIRGKVFNKHVIGTYVPFYKPGDREPTTKPIMVVEIYSDVSERIDQHSASRNKVIAAVFFALLISFTTIIGLANKASRTLRNVAQAKKDQEDRLIYQALHDALTDLPNRAKLNEFRAELSQQIDAPSLNTLLIDLNNFKSINVSLGHGVGDSTLKSVVNIIKKTCNPKDKIFRTGGDEFLIVTKQSNGQKVLQLAQQLKRSIGAPLQIEGQSVNLQASIGIARWPQDHSSFEQVLRYADMAMHSARLHSDQSIDFFRPEMRRAQEEADLMLTGLQIALASNQFVLHYQPRLHSSSRKIAAIEALIRWQHPRLGLLPPARFIETLENSPLIVEVGNWVIETACKQLVQWHKLGHTELRISVNVAARQFKQANFIAALVDILDRTGLSAKYLELEITEGQLINDLSATSSTLSALRNIGVTVSIDDFGTGYSSLAYLHQLPINCIKIDRSFVLAITSDKRQRSIAQTIALLGHTLEMSVVAEGVETIDQAEMLTGWGCAQLQGYLFSKPVTDIELLKILNNETASSPKSKRHVEYQGRVIQKTDRGINVEIAYSD